MTRSRIFFALFAAWILLVAGVAGNAAGATAAATSATSSVAPAAKAAAPYVTGVTEVQIWPQADSNIPTQAVVITDVTLPSDTKLPATVRIPIVPGTKVMWAGESLDGASPDADPPRQIKEVEGAGGGKYAEFVLSKSFRGQIDSTGIPLTFNSDEIAFSVQWVQSTETSSVLFTVRFPAGSSRVKIDPKPQGDPRTNMAGESLYALPEMKLTSGAKQTISASYSTNPSGEQAVSDTLKTTIYVVLGVLLVAALALLAFLFVRRGSPGSDEPGQPDRQMDDSGSEASADDSQDKRVSPDDDLDAAHDSEGRD